MNCRHEWKHEINPADLILLRQRLSAVMQRDSHAPEGAYLVRSLYFDTPADTTLREKLDGVNNREKFRIRCYNHDLSLIRLEKKSKRNGLGSKEAANLTPQEVRFILEGDRRWMKHTDRPLGQELYDKMLVQGLRPKTLVDYIREPFVYAAGNVRVTLDHSIRTGLGSVDLLNLEIRLKDDNTDLYHRFFREFLDTVDVSAIIQNAKALIAPYVEKDPTKFCTYEEFETGVQTLEAFCRLRSQSVAAQLAGEEAKVDASSIVLSNMGTMNHGGEKGHRREQESGNCTANAVQL